MKVIEVTRFGGPDVLRPADAPEPEAGPGQVVIGVSVVDVMSLDAQLRTGWGQEWFPNRPPFVPGTGVAGRVLSAGQGVDPGWVGRRVAALLPGGGGYAERVAAGVDTLVEVPGGLSLRRAAALLQVGPAALGLTDAAGLGPGTRVLVTGAGGGLGLPLVMLAAAAGARVTAAARGEAKREAALRYGAAETVDYAALTDPEEHGGRAFDVVLDGVGGQVGGAAFRLVAPGGVFFAYGVPSGSTAPVDQAEAERRGVRLVGMEQVRFGPEEFRRLAARTMEEAAAGRLATEIGLAVPLERAPEAHAALESRALVGKAVLLATARAARYRRHGGPEVLEVEEVPLPQPGPGQVRVAVRAAGVNPIDWKLRAGLMGGAPQGPVGTGMELAGTVDALGPGVEGLPLGLPVFGQAPPGAVATHALADASTLAPIPDGLSFEEAAALPVALETARRALLLLGPRPGETLLVHAVAGGVGLAAAQLAAAEGVRVVGTASERHHARLKELGIEPVTYGEGLEERVPGPVDKVLDASGRDVLEVSVKLAGGPDRVVTIADPAGAARHGVRFSSSGGHAAPPPNPGAVRVPVAETFPLERVADAHRRSQDGHFLGKLVVVMDAEGLLPR
ncbi:NADPH:quinone reductase [Nonomuraea pusilla]|uniref:NADPH:quinone reductase n=1 Tax=Nonomuraea pusilla TaxID=46177 RepID=A0A1H7LY96_9ACTN|nr:zinc-binding dehydrogenase [Nonomuraea pusilla]SEL03943.1 NADPH:quinone reductase [Nonomuraea pusilla]